MGWGYLEILKILSILGSEFGREREREIIMLSDWLMI